MPAFFDVDQSRIDKMHWFQANAPIRLKMMIVVLSFVALVVGCGVTASTVGGTAGIL